MSEGEAGSAEARYWGGRARSVAFKVNSGWWLDRLILLVVSFLLLFAVAVLLMRTLGPRWMATPYPMIALGTLVVVSMLASFLWSRSRFIGKSEGFARLDDRLGLRNRLTTAANDVGRWPGIPEEGQARSGAPAWRWPLVLLPVLFSSLVLAVAWLVPLPEREAHAPAIVNEPESWGQMDDWVMTLEEEELIEPDSLEEIEEKIEELRKQPEEEWFSHASLEATDTLKDSLGRDIRELAGDMATLERDLEALRTFSTELTEEGKEMLMREFEEAMKNLAASGLEMNESLAKQLSQIDPSQLGEKTLSNLSQSDLESLQKQLQGACNALGSMEGLPSMESDPSLLTMQPGFRPGMGGIERGRADAPLFFGDEDDLGTNNIESVDNEDMSRAVLGDLIGIGETEHDDEEKAGGPQAGGAVSSGGKGGDAVWRESLVPSEKALLKRYFQ
jgi:hypothetical protein